MSSQIILVFCILIFSQPIIGEDDHDHDDHGEEEGALHHIFEHLNVTTKDHEGHLVAERHHLEKLFYDLNFKNCSQDLESTTCSLCMRAEEFLSWNGLGKKSNFSEEDFHEFIGGFVYLLSFPSNDNAVCKNVIKNITSTSPSFYNQILTEHGVGSLNETGIEKILEQINSTIGVKLSSKKCFSAHEVFKAVNKSHSASLNEEQFEQASAFIVSQLVEKHCIEEEHHDDDHDDHDHDHDHDHEEDLPKPEYFIEEIFEAYGEENKTGISPEKFKDFYKKVKLGNQTAEDDHDDHDDHDEHEGHDHKRRRRATDDDEHAKYKKCYSAEQILEIYGLTKGSRINQTKFSEICPSLIQQLDSGVCASSEQTTKTPGEEHHDDEEPKWRPWIGMIVSITIISLASLAGACTTPVTHKRWFELLLVTMIALAVAVMIGDAVLHLFPHALNLHGHDDGHDHAHEDGNPLLKEDSYIWKSLLLLLGVYIFMQFELVMNVLGAGHSHGQAADHVISNGNANGSLPMNDEKKPTTFEYADSTPKKGLRMKDFQTVVWMIIIGDALHNFLDGVAIGTAFTDTDKSYLGGISTSIAIFAHELPHELGDFAVLISSGLSIKQALMMNFLSSLTAFVGGFVGVAMGLEWKASPWIFAITAGLFIYIALVNMLPEILHSNVLKTRKALTIALVNVGLWIGFAIMFILGVYEDDIKSSL
uniref:Uncharacterized protein n=2 Tax=Clytia hemisphaerica TaxID=252671 RepID=A0A7M6DR13_9CNID